MTLPRINENEYMEIDADKLKTYIKGNTPLSISEFALEIGRSRKYITNMSGRTKIPDYVLNVICKRLSISPEQLLWKDPESEQDLDRIGLSVVNAINNLSKQMEQTHEYSRQVLKRLDDLEKPYRRVGIRPMN